MRTDGDRYAEYDVRVYGDDGQDATATGLQRALHAELCRDRPHGDSPWPACWRAEQVVRKWERNVAEAVDAEFDPLRAYFLTGIMQTRRAIAAQESVGGVPAAAPPEYAPPLTEDERLAALNALRAAEGNVPLAQMPPESSWADAERVQFDRTEGTP